MVWKLQPSEQTSNSSVSDVWPGVNEGSKQITRWHTGGLQSKTNEPKPLILLLHGWKPSILLICSLAFQHFWINVSHCSYYSWPNYEAYLVITAKNPQRELQPRGPTGIFFWTLAQPYGKQSGEKGRLMRKTLGETTGRKKRRATSLGLWTEPAYVKR